MIRHQPGHEYQPLSAGFSVQIVEPKPLDGCSGAMEAVRVRTLAQSLLRRLAADRASSVERFREAGSRDAIEVVTGRTSFDNAISATRHMISRMDALLEEFARETGVSTEANEVVMHL